MLWDIIRDFFCTHVFGGTTSEGVANYGAVSSNLDSDLSLTIGNESIALADYLSTTATIITLILLVIGLFIVVKWLFKIASGLIRW